MDEPSEVHEVVVIVDPQCRQPLDRVAAALSDAGMQVDQLLEEIGMISGTVSAERESELKSVEGVQHVERSRPYDVQ